MGVGGHTARNPSWALDVKRGFSFSFSFRPGLGEAPTKAFRAPPRFSLSSSPSFSEHPQLSSSFHHPASLGERSVALIFGVLRASHFSGSSWCACAPLIGAG